MGLGPGQLREWHRPDELFALRQKIIPDKGEIGFYGGTMTKLKNLLLIGGHGKVGLLATPKLVDAGIDVTSLYRTAAQTADIKAGGATPLLRDVTELSVQDWADLFADVDTVVWSAGNGGKGGADTTYAVDRDAAIASIDGAASLGDSAPRYLMVSFLGSTSLHVDPSDSFYPYAESKKAADKHLAASGLDYLILAPSTLTEEPAGGVDHIADNPEAGADRTSSRELVADVITEFALREDWPKKRELAFVDGKGNLADL